MEQTRIYTALKGVRGRLPVNLDQLAGLLTRFSQMIASEPRVAELDVNPLICTGDSVTAVDALIVPKAH